MSFSNQDKEPFKAVYSKIHNMMRLFPRVDRLLTKTPDGKEINLQEPGIGHNVAVLPIVHGTGSDENKVFVYLGSQFSVSSKVIYLDSFEGKINKYHPSWIGTAKAELEEEALGIFDKMITHETLNSDDSTMSFLLEGDSPTRIYITQTVQLDGQDANGYDAVMMEYYRRRWIDGKPGKNSRDNAMPGLHGAQREHQGIYKVELSQFILFLENTKPNDKLKVLNRFNEP